MGTVVGIVVAVVILVIIVAVVFFVLNRRNAAERERRSAALKDRFGSEYDRAVNEYGSADAAESALASREERVKKLDIRSLSPQEQSRFAAAWQSAQARFVDDPPGAVHDADRLVAQVMQARNYPVGDFAQQASTVSVDYPEVVENYRAAHRIALRQEEGQANTEDLRQAMVHYRALFQNLLQTDDSNAVSS
jgi:ABC-type multidrug transport system fused ATPase/permease subunit